MSGLECARLTQHLELDRSQPPASRARRSVRIASSAVKQPAVLVEIGDFLRIDEIHQANSLAAVADV